MKKNKFVIFNVIVPLFVGGLLYILFRSRSLIMFSWFDMIGISGLINSIKIFFNPVFNYLPKWVLFSLPDGLWVYSFSSSLIIIWYENFKTARYWLILPCLIEPLQYLKILPGTFDIMDFIICLLASILSVIIINSKIQKNEKQII